MATQPKRPRDMNQLAKLIVDMTVGEAPPDIEPTDNQAETPSGKKKVAKPKKSTTIRRKKI